MDTNIIVGTAAGIMVLVNLVAAVLILAHKRIVSERAKDVLGKVLYYVDEFCDNVEKPASRAQVIMALQSVLGFGIAGRRIFLPAVIVGWILDAEVKILRWLQVPDLHQATIKNEEAQP